MYARYCLIMDTRSQRTGAMNRISNGTALTLGQLGEESRSASSARVTIILQDLRPDAILYLSALLNINPVCFVRNSTENAYLETFDPTVLVFDYPETLLYGGNFPDSARIYLTLRTPREGNCGQNIDFHAFIKFQRPYCRY